jgi:glycogen(starch) synthase
MLLDYTAALARKRYDEWAPFASDQSWRAWQRCERHAYGNAAQLFPFGSQTRASLVNDYGVSLDKITVIGSGGHFSKPYRGNRTFGSKQMLFYCADGPEFWRKGGDRVLSAFRQIRQHIPDAKLAIVGKAARIKEPGVENHGHISSRQKMSDLFLNSDLVLAPSRCDPFPGFLIEAMNFGTPCIVSDTDGMPEIVDHQVNGMVLSDASGAQIADVVVSLFRDTERLRAMSNRGRRKVRERLNWEYVSNMIADRIREISVAKNDVNPSCH